jgi:acetyl-CoA carboxylase carboxyltransferase component
MKTIDFTGYRRPGSASTDIAPGYPGLMSAIPAAIYASAGMMTYKYTFSRAQQLSDPELLKAVKNREIPYRWVVGTGYINGRKVAINYIKKRIKKWEKMQLNEIDTIQDLREYIKLNMPGAYLTEGESGIVIHTNLISTMGGYLEMKEGE